jgi:hypothetical protein
MRGLLKLKAVVAVGAVGFAIPEQAPTLNVDGPDQMRDFRAVIPVEVMAVVVLLNPLIQPILRSPRLIPETREAVRAQVVVVAAAAEKVALLVVKLPAVVVAEVVALQETRGMRVIRERPLIPQLLIVFPWCRDRRIP